MVTKKRLAWLTVVLTILYFLPLMYLPESIVGTRKENLLMFSFKIGFLSISAAAITGIILMLVFKRAYIKDQIVSFNRFKHLLWLLVKRDFISRYRKSVLGVLWSLLNPLLTMLVLTLVFSYLFQRQIENFPVYLLSGQIIFGFFNESTSQAMRAIIGGEGIIKKVYVPKYIFPLAKVLSSLVNLGFSFLAFLLIFVVTRAPLHWTILLVPIPIIYTFIFSLGVGMFLSAVAVFFRDLTYLYGVFTVLLTYLTPLFYPISIIPDWLLPYMAFNPIYHFVEYFRNVALYGIVPGLWANIVCLGLSLMSLCCGVYVFMSQQQKYILNL